MKSENKRLPVLAGGGTAVFLLLLLLIQAASSARAAPASNLFGYGFNVAAWDIDRMQQMGFNWIKVFNGPGSRLPLKVLMRVEANAGHLGNVNAFGNQIGQLAAAQKGYVDAYEIGNEPNLDATYGWGHGSTNVPPKAADYVTLLCTAYTRIKAVDPNAIVVSAGLAPTGRVQGNWNGHKGHNGLFQDEREFFKEFVAAGGGACADAIGYHPYGYAADYDVAPDTVVAGQPARSCANGFCFRGAEALYDLMQAQGLGDKKMWATEFGWIVRPPDSCLNDPTWSGRSWQIVTEQKQAQNLAGAFEYATTHWPWMEAMFIFNLNFNQAGYYAPCEQMRFYAVQGRPAEAALQAMPKVGPAPVAELTLGRPAVAAVITQAQQPVTVVETLALRNSGTLPLTYAVSADGGAALVPALNNANGSLAPGEETAVTLTINSSGRAAGSYAGELTITTAEAAQNTPATVPLTLYVFDDLYQTFLPLVRKP